MMNDKRSQSVIYVNFSPYENAGRILDYLQDTFKYVILFSFNFHKLGRTKRSNKIYIFHNKKVIQKLNLYQIPVPRKLVFPLLPIRSMLIFIQIFLYSSYLKNKYSQIDYYFTVNAFTAWVGQVVKRFGFVKNTIFWVWDYYPPLNDDKIIMFMRKIYWQFDKISSNSDRLIFLNKRLKELREKIGILDLNKNSSIVPIGTEIKFSSKRLPKNSVILCFIGVLKKSQGLGLVFQNLPKLQSLYPQLRIEIIGSGPDENYFKNLAKGSTAKINFYGFLDESQNKKISRIFSNSTIGIATYVPEKSNVSYYGDPSKIKMYLSFGLPVITTNVFAFSEEIRKTKSGIIINYHKKGELITAINKINRNYSYYRNNAKKLAKKYYYKKLYAEMFR